MKKTNEQNVGCLAIMQIKGKRIIAALPLNDSLDDLVEHFKCYYAAVIIDVKDIWVN
ncbi:hypothetical protein MCHI_002955 [Candidatus Magnetoovum chiemensis]|nr:hypothetical protein MCHI_002955 [Candidatus Magnetoovum chiemensis]